MITSSGGGYRSLLDAFKCTVGGSGGTRTGGLQRMMQGNRGSAGVSVVISFAKSRSRGKPPQGKPENCRNCSRGASTGFSGDDSPHAPWSHCPLRESAGESERASSIRQAGGPFSHKSTRRATAGDARVNEIRGVIPVLCRCCVVSGCVNLTKPLRLAARARHRS